MSLLKPVSRYSYDNFISLVQQEAAAIVSGLRDFLFLLISLFFAKRADRAMRKALHEIQRLIDINKSTYFEISTPKDIKLRKSQRSIFCLIGLFR